jgi:hypothetical protein
MKHPTQISLWQAHEHAKGIVTTNINSKWVPARPLGYQSFRSRLKLAWMVFTGRADALVWPENQ